MKRGRLIRRGAYLAAALVAAALVIAPLLRGTRVPRARSQGDRLRVVSLAPSATEMLFALGAGESVVGVTDRCDYPPEARQIGRVGGFGAPSVEKMLALAPDLVIATGLERPDATATLRRSGIRFLWLKTGSFTEMFESLRQIGREVDQRERAEQLVTAMQAELDAVAAACRHIPLDRRPRVFVELWDDPLTTVGGRSFVDELVTRAGGVNVAREIDSAYPTINPEKVVEWNPDVIVLGYMSQKGPTESLADRIGWSEITAIRTGRIVSDIPLEILLRPGPRLVEGVKALSRRLHRTATEETAANQRPASPGGIRTCQ